MKRKLIIIFSLLLTSINCFTQNAEPKHYSDYLKDFSGYAAAIFWEIFQNWITSEKMNFLK